MLFFVIIAGVLVIALIVRKFAIDSAREYAKKTSEEYVLFRSQLTHAEVEWLDGIISYLDANSLKDRNPSKKGIREFCENDLRKGAAEDLFGHDDLYQRLINVLYTKKK